MASRKKYNSKTKSLNSIPSYNTLKSLSKHLKYLHNQTNVNKPYMSSKIKINWMFKSKTIKHILINLQNNLYQTKPYKKTDSKSINAPNSVNKPFKNLKNKNNFKKKEIRKRENNLKNKSRKKINELSNLSTKSFN
jgi:hypothetical protein